MPEEDFQIQDEPTPVPAPVGFVLLAPGTIASDFSLKNLNKSLGEAQTEFLPSVKDEKNDYVGYMYVPLEAIVAAVRPSLTKYHLTVSQFPVTDLESKTITIYTRIVHWDSGEWMQNSLELPAELALGRDGAMKFNQQTIGGSQTYAQKYAYKAIVGIPDSEGDLDSGDEGGNLVGRGSKGKKPPTVCPSCGVAAIVKGKEEYGGGWLCYKAKGGCGAKFAVDPADAISHQENAPRPTTTQQSTQRAHQSAETAPTAAQPQAGVFKMLPPPEENNLVCVVKGVIEKHTNPADGKTKPKPYLVVTVNGFMRPECDPDNPNINFMFCYDTKLFDALKGSIESTCQFELDLTGKFVKLVDVVNVAGEEYVDGKPVQVQGEQQ